MYMTEEQPKRVLEVDTERVEKYDGMTHRLHRATKTGDLSRRNAKCWRHLATTQRKEPQKDTNTPIIRLPLEICIMLIPFLHVRYTYLVLYFLSNLIIN